MKSSRSLKPAMVVAAVSLVAMVVLVACGGSSGGSGAAGGTPQAAAGGSSVTIANFAFSPQTLTVKKGTTVTWTNNDSMPHNVTSADGISTGAATTSMFSSGMMAPKQTFSFTFSTPGTYYYECTIHAAKASMHGKVIVQ